MSVIWSGITEEGAVVPVQVTDEGKVVAVGDGPQGDYLPITGGELTGDLDVDGSISAGSISAAGNLVIGDDPEINVNNVGTRIWNTGTIYTRTQSIQGYCFAAYPPSGSTPTLSLSTDGSITAASVAADGEGVFGNSTFTGPGTALYPSGSVYLQAAANDTSAALFVVNSSDVNNPAASVLHNGSAMFSGDVVIGSRGTKWLIRESNGVAMLIEQSRRGQIEPRMEKVRDLPNELDLIEAALSEVMAKLKMVPPAGWPVWDGQDEVTSDNDNA